MSEYWRLAQAPPLFQGEPAPWGPRGVPQGTWWRGKWYPAPYSLTPPTALGKPMYVEPYGGAGLTPPGQLEEARREAAVEKATRDRQQAIIRRLPVVTLTACSTCGSYFHDTDDCKE